ncbi:MAG: hypothetical protein HQL24_10040 [Candidatus Omnitrophica bacterium]|nr:hypothetical protein [Candidatus Omnitrophota bacterium]
MTNIFSKINNIKLENIGEYLNLQKLKNINAADLKESILSDPGIVIKYLLIILTFFTVLHTYQKHQEKSGGLNKNILQNEKLLTAINEYNATKKNYENFIKNFPQGLPAYQLLDELANISAQNNVHILNFSPATEKDFSQWKMALVNMTITSSDYNNMVRYIQSLENSHYALRVERWTGSPSQEQGEKTIKATIDISSMVLKND